MLSGSTVRRQISVAMMVLLVFGGVVCADTWNEIFWQDDFSDGDYTNDPTWTVFGSPGSSAAVTDFTFRHTAPFIAQAGAGWSGAFVSQLEGNQGMTGWINTSPTANNDWAALVLLRYSAPQIAFGTGYALAVTHNSAEQITAQLYQMEDDGYSEITDSALILSSYSDVRVRFLATGTDGDTLLRARVWADGDPEPDVWNLSSADPGGTDGITSFFNAGFGGLGVVTTTDGVLADAYFDDMAYGVPEPATMILMATGVGALILRGRRRKS